MEQSNPRLVLKSSAIDDLGVRITAKDGSLHIQDVRTGAEFAVLIWEHHGSAVQLRPLGEGSEIVTKDGGAWIFAPE